MAREEIIGKNIMLRRVERGYSQKELSEKIDFSQKEISRYERGEIKRLNYDFLKAIAKVFEIRIDELEDEEYVKMSMCKEDN